jgi:hypothetical protein
VRTTSRAHATWSQDDTNLRVEKVFAQAFGDILAVGLLMDPEFTLPHSQPGAAPMPLQCLRGGAVVVGGRTRTSALVVNVTTRLATIITGGMHGMQQQIGRTRTFSKSRSHKLVSAMERDMSTLRPDRDHPRSAAL